jgi:hypothetical protein
VVSLGYGYLLPWIGRTLALTSELDVVPVHAADWRLRAGAATHIEHTDRYRQVVYADARDGWYSSPGATLAYGVFGGYSFTNVDVVVRAGQRRDFQLDTWMLPFYATAGVDARLPAWGK